MDSNVPGLLDEVESLVKRLREHNSDPSNSSLRKSLRTAATRLSVALESPEEIIDRIVYHPLTTALIRIAIDLGIFKLVIESNVPMGVKELAAATGADRVLLGRVLRGLASVDALEEAGTGEYVATKISKAFTTEQGVSNLRSYFDSCEYAWHELPAFLARTHYENPSDPLHTPFQDGARTDKVIYAWFKDHPEVLDDFNTFMSTHFSGRANWLDFFPADQELIQGFHHGEGAAMFVDVGGALGHQIQMLLERYPAMPGRMVLQDLPDTIKKVTATNMEAVAHDFFTPQPVQGARAYYFRSVLHNWPDASCRLILQHTAAAMTPAYSKVLIHEMVMPTRGANAFMTHLDLNMMAVLAAMERTEVQWHQLLESAGLRIVKIWGAGGDEEAESVIEAMLF